MEVKAGNPLLWQPHYRGGLILDRLGRTEEAVKWLEEAERLARGRAPVIGQALARVRAKVGKPR